MPRNTRIDVNALRKLVARNGDTLIHTVGLICPCRVNRAQADANCLICHGVGFFWDDTQRRQIKGIVFTPMMHKELIIEGQFESGDLLVSQDAGRYPLINVNDRIELTTTAGEGFEGEVRLVSTVNGTRITILSYQPVMVEDVFSGNPRTGVISKYKVMEKEAFSDRDDEIPNADGYFQRVLPNGQRARWITWNPGKGPPDGQNVSIKYRARFEYICMEQPEYRFQRDDDLGQLVHLRLKQRFYSNIADNPVGPETPVTPSPPEVNAPHWGIKNIAT